MNIYESVFPSVPRRFLFVPLIAVILFLTVMGVFLFVLRTQERESQALNLARNAEWVKVTVNQRLFVTQGFLFTVADNVSRQRDVQELKTQVSQHLSSNLELLSIAYLNADGVIEWAVPALSDLFSPGKPPTRETLLLFDRVKKRAMVGYSPIFKTAEHGYVFEVQIPVFRREQFIGTIIGCYTLERFLLFLTPQAFQKRYGIVMLDDSGQVLQSSVNTSARELSSANNHFTLTQQGARLHFEVFSLDEPDQIVQEMLFGLVIGLSFLLIFSFVFLFRHMHFRLKAEQVLDRFFNLSLDVFCIIRADGHFHLINPAFSRLLGYDVMKRSMRFFDIVHPEDREQMVEELAILASAKKQAIVCELRCICIDDGYRWLEWAIHADVQHRFFYAAAHDVTMRKNRELDLAAEHTFQKVIENSIITAIRVVDLTGKTIYVNPAFCRMTGFSEDVLLGKKPPFPYWHVEEYQASRTLFDQLLMGDLSNSGTECRFVRQDGSILFARLYMSPVIKEDRITGWMSMFLDITERKRAQKAIEGAYGQFMRVFDSLDVAVSVCAESETGNVELLFANRYYERIFGNTSDGHLRLINRVGEEYTHKQPNVQIECNRTLLPMNTESEAVGGVIYCSPKKRWFDVRIRHIRWIDDRIVQLQHATDITEQKLIEEMQAKQQETLQFNSRLITMGEMASSLAHELNQPLAAIANYVRGSISRLQGGRITETELVNVLEKVTHQAERAGKIIKRIRDFVQKSAPKREWISLAVSIDNAIGLAEITAKKCGIQIQRDIPYCPSVLADAILIEQLVFNLLKNAMEAMENPEKPWIRIEVRTYLTHIEVSVIDHGHGIPNGAENDIYMAFFTTKTEGMGMGLNICRSIIELHSGRIWCEPNPVGGTIFKFTLPIQ